MSEITKETFFNPSVRILNKEHRIIIAGQSRSEDPVPFYEELQTILYDKIEEVKTHITIDFILTYMNSASSKCLFHVLKDLQNKFQGKKLITINWFYDVDDDSMLEAGEVFQSLLNIPFYVIKAGR
jgi:hypothetical protein